MIASRMEHIAPFHVMEVIRRCRELEAAGRSIVHMEVGEPDFPTPEPIVEAGCKALRDGRTGYTESKGIVALREAIAANYQRRYGQTVDVERIVVTPGASGALQLAATVLLDVGDEVLMADPSYPCNRHFVSVTDATPVLLPVGADSAYQPTAELIAEHWSDRTRAVMLASPSNPTGTVIAPAALESIVALSESRGARVVMDEIYHGLCYDDASEKTALSVSDDAFVINSFSKYFGMTGWRLGWLVVPQDCLRAVEKLSQNLFICASTVAQYAALAAFEAPTLAVCEQRRAAFRERRDYLLPALRELGFEIPCQPEGAFYLYADCSALLAPGERSDEFAFRCLENAGVAFTPGIDFGRHEADRHVRFAYTNSLQNLSDGVERLRRFLVA